MSEKPRSTALTVYDEMSKPSFLGELSKAIPNTLKPERMVRLALTLLRKNETLAKCSKESIMACVVETAQLGLEPEGVLGHAYIVPFAGEATLIIGYRGFTQLIYNSGMIAGLSAEVVRAGERFNIVLGTERRLIHVPNPIPMKQGKEEPDDPESRWLGAYAAVQFIHGGRDFEYMDKALIYSHRARSRSWQKHVKENARSPWHEYPDKIAMWCKTPLRKMAKRMPTSTTDNRANLLRAVMLDEYGERKGLLTPTLGGFEVNPNPPDEADEEPIAPTREVIDVSPGTAASNPQATVEQSTKAAGGRSARSTATTGAKKTGRRQSAGNGAPSNPLVPKANLQGLPAKPAPAPPADDPFLTSREQTMFWDKALVAGWKIDELRVWLKKNGYESPAKIRKSQFAKLMTAIESGTGTPA